MRQFISVCLSTFLLGPLLSQDIPATPGNIQYGRSCNDNRIWYWLSAPKRGEWLRLMIDAGMNGVPTHSVAWISLGFMKSSRTVAFGCTLLAEPTWAWGIDLRDGWAYKHLFKIPSDPALKGLPLFSQAAHVGFRGTAFSRGIQMSVR